MRLLVVIPHYFYPQGTHARHASGKPNAAARVQALAACISALHVHFGTPQHSIHIGARRVIPSNAPYTLNIVICTTKNRHVLNHLPLPPGLFTHQPVQTEPLYLGFACHQILRENLGQYDYYAYLEDDLIVQDALLLDKILWFRTQAGVESVLQPNRYEASLTAAARKTYIDGDLRPEVTAPFQDVTQTPHLSAQFLGKTWHFERALNPHAGCFFLDEEQLSQWVARPEFGQPSGEFISPLESAATLGLMRVFKVYKPARPNANFLEIQHSGNQFARLVRQKNG